MGTAGLDCPLPERHRLHRLHRLQTISRVVPPERVDVISLFGPDGGQQGRSGDAPVDASVPLAFVHAQHPESRALLGTLEKPTCGHGFLGHPPREALWEKGEGR